MNEQEKDELIERILLDQVPDEEKPRVKQLLAADEDLQAKLRFQLQIRQAVLTRQKQEARAMFQKFDQEAKTLPLFSSWQQIAAVIAFMLVAGSIWLFIRFNNSSHIEEGVVQLPLYELQDIGLGIGKNDQAVDSVITVISRETPASYEFTDTLKIYLPELPSADIQLKLAYERSSDTYYLLSGTTRYELIKGLEGKQALREVRN